MSVFSGPPVDLPRAVGLWLLVAGLAFPAGSGAQESPVPVKKSGGSLFSRIFDSKPPWAVEAPGAAGSRYGLGLDLFFEHQESLRFTFMEQTLRARDFLGEESGVVRTDPGLLNRKFDLSLDLAGAGVQPAVALPLPRTLGVYSTLVFQAALADVRLDFDDLNRPEDSSSLEGQGPLFGTGLDLTRALCRSCPWFAGASYRFQRLPSLAAGRMPSFSPPDFEVLEDEVRLSRDAHDASLRVGYGFPGNRIVSYLGVSHRRTDVEIEDHLRYREPFREVETTLDSRTQLESEVTLGLAGVEAQLGDRLFSRLETSVGEGDWGVLFRVVYTGPERRTDEGNLETVRRLKAIAAVVAPQIAEIRARFLAGWRNLTIVEESSGPAYLVRELQALLGRTQRELLGVLSQYPDLKALEDWVQDKFRHARILAGLEPTSPATDSTGGTPATTTTFAALRLPNLPSSREDLRRTQMGRTSVKTFEGNKGFGVADQALVQAEGAAQRGFHVQLTLVAKLDEQYKYPELRIFLRKNDTVGRRFSPAGKPVMPVGSYSWKFYVNKNKEDPLLECDGNKQAPDSLCPMDLVEQSCWTITCSESDCTPNSGRCPP